MPSRMPLLPISSSTCSVRLMSSNLCRVVQLSTCPTTIEVRPGTEDSLASSGSIDSCVGFIGLLSRIRARECFRGAAVLIDVNLILSSVSSTLQRRVYFGRHTDRFTADSTIGCSAEPAPHPELALSAREVLRADYSRQVGDSDRGMDPWAG
jgi:hypothetical protein